MHADRLAPSVPGADVAEVGPAGVAAKAHQEGGGEAPGRVGVKFRDAEGSLGEPGYCGVVAGRPGKLPVSRLVASH